MSLDTRYLNAFLAVAQHGTLGRAAHTLNITQPALSRSIKKLEAQLGALLFERYTTGMVLTPYGQALLPHATILQHQAGQAVEEIAALRGLAKGTLRVGAVASAISQVLPLAIARVLHHWPNLQVQIVEGVGDLLTDALLKYEIDLAIGVSLTESDDICAIADANWQDTSTIIAASTHPLRKKKRLRLEDTLGYQWVLPPEGTAPYTELTRLFSEHALPLPEVVVQTRSIIAIKSLVTHAGFLNWMPMPMYEAERLAGLVTALPVEHSPRRRELLVFRRRQGLLPTPALKLLDALREVVAQDPMSSIGKASSPRRR